MNLAVCGTGRAGKVMLEKIICNPEHNLKMVVNRNTSKSINTDIGNLLGTVKQNISVTSIDNIGTEIHGKNVDVIIDFSHRDTSLQLLEKLKKTDVKFVICTTNFSKEQNEYIQKMQKLNNMGIVYAPNLTIGINLLMRFVQHISVILPDFDFEIIEKHRKDKPLVTTTAELISKVINRGDTPISSIRAGGFVGVHEVIAANESECITITHESFSREAFANGAMLAAEFIYKKNGYYEMQDVIDALEQKIRFTDKGGI